MTTDFREASEDRECGIVLDKQHFLEIALRDHPLVLAETIFRPAGAAARPWQRSPRHGRFPPRALEFGREIPDIPRNIRDFRVQVGFYVRMVADLFRSCEASFGAVSSPESVCAHAEDCRRAICFLFDQRHVEVLLRKVERSRHARQAAADDQRGLVDAHAFLIQRLRKLYFCDCGAHQVARFVRGLFRLLLVHPRAMLPDIGEFEHVRVDAGLFQGLLEERFVRPWRAGGHHQPVELMLGDRACVLLSGNPARMKT